MAIANINPRQLPACLPETDGGRKTEHRTQKAINEICRMFKILGINKINKEKLYKLVVKKTTGVLTYRQTINLIRLSKIKNFAHYAPC